MKKMTRNELLAKYYAERSKCNQKHTEARKLRHQATDIDTKRIHELDQENYAAKMALISEFILDLSNIDIQKSLYDRSYGE